MPLIPLAATFFSTVIASSMFGFEGGILAGLLVAVLSLQVVGHRRHRKLQLELDHLRAQLALVAPGAAERSSPSRPATSAEDPGAEAPQVQTPDRSGWNVERDPGGDIAAAADPGAEAASIAGSASLPGAPRNTLSDRAERLLRRAAGVVVSYFTDGNLFVRIGLLVLFFGVAFLLKYAAEHTRVPLELRFMGAALGGLILLVFGWRLRARKQAYALLLQGGGIGVLYITIFAAFRIADLLPPLLTFALLIGFATFTVALAILQNSKALAVFAVLGGFLAPLLASTGSGNYIGLFSYYAVLNAAVFGIAWFRAWRALNLVGFLFTFGVFALWAVLDYQDPYLYPASAFLLLYFLMYSLIGVLYALRQPQHLAGLVDGTLVFGTPVIVSSLLMLMLRNYEYGIAGTSAAMGVYYVLIARFSWRRVGEDVRLLAEAMLAIGVVFATIAIPYALDGHWSTAAWALEAAGILWVSLRQNRFYAQCFAVLLQVGAGVLFLLGNTDDVGDQIWLNPAFLGGVFVALGAFFSSRLLYLQPSDHRLRPLHGPFFLWAMGWWLVSVLVQTDRYLAQAQQEIAWLILFVGTAGVAVFLDRIRGWNWKPAAVTASLLMPVLGVLALDRIALRDHLFTAPAGFFWAGAFAANYWFITRLESVDWRRWVTLGQHTGIVVVVALVASVELVWVVMTPLGATGQGFEALVATAPMVALYLSLTGRLPAIGRLGAPLQLSLVATLSMGLGLWSVATNLGNSGNPAPLPYVPFLNPLDLHQIAFFLLVLTGLKSLPPAHRSRQEPGMMIIAALVFLWLTAVLLRSLHHYLPLPFDLAVMLDDTRVQTAISILWTVIGMVAMLVASRRGVRRAWIVGAALVGVVLVKMFFIDLGASGTVERIVSFLVVGALLVANGYFSPIPQQVGTEANSTGASDHA